MIMCWIFNEISNGTMLMSSASIEKSKSKTFVNALRADDSDSDEDESYGYADTI